ncbi:tyrosine-type recombinase/integrase [Streptomyces sp. NPDC051963]|uniref:tyrosine-type recombinase/integrase n=1 Tax=Streptomyces sp. NPDC051963 TaxID=3365678 RepID=UPI0037D96D1D
MRAAMLDELELHLSTTTNRLGRPYQQGTVRAYLTGARTLHRWMTAAGVEEDFTAVDTALLNRFFRHHYDTHDVPKSQDGKGGYTGGTSTLQRNVRVLFAWLEEEYEVPNPWRDKKLHRYSAPPQGKPKTLSSEFVTDCLKVTGNGNPRIRDFETTRDHAIIRVLTEGLRSEELLNLRVQDLDLHGHTLVVVPLKGDRNSQDGRTIPLQPKTVRALQRYLRAREEHSLSQGPWLWLGTRNRNRLRYSGLYRMVKRRAEEAGYDSAEVSPHSYCHTWTDDLLSSGVSGENVMAVRGWKSPAMLRRYAHDQASQRAVSAVHQLGDRY